MTQQQPTPDYRSLLQAAWQEMRQMRLELAAVQLPELPGPEPIAIIGMDCRFPGGANSPEAYWDLLQKGRRAITEVPPERWDLSAYYDPNPEVPGKLYSRHGGFIEQVDQFDPQFFGISPREAVSLDPQQRLLLEVSYGALERAGQAPDQLRGSQTGVYIGISFEDYAKRSLHSGDVTRIDAYSSLGNTRSIAAGRLSYVLGLQGATMQLDTTCSSSLLAVHLACQSLRSGELTMALAGGVNLMLSPEPTIGFCKLKALSPDGYCRTFDANANGYIRGEGCGIVVLKRLADAVTNHDLILAVIRGSAVNHDGQSNGLTAPNGQAQEAVIRQAVRQAGIEAAQVQYVEAHGTGTALGDPIEVLALGQALGNRSVDQPLWISSVKPNIGHLESAAGVAGLIKTVLALQHRQIPPHLHFQQPNPHIPWEQLALKVPTALTPWHSEQLRLAGVSSFGMSGTNAHVILEEFVNEQMNALDLPDTNPQPHLFTLSAKSPSALRQLAERYEDFLSTQSDQLLPHICFTANTGRSQFDCRFAVRVSTVDQLQQQLRQFRQEGTFAIPSDNLAQRYLQGSEVDWSHLNNTQYCQRLLLPTYPFQKQRYWMEPPAVRSRAGHPLLGQRLALANAATIHFEAQLDANHPTFLQQHCVFGEPIMPMAGYVEMALAAGKELFQSTQLAVQIAVHTALSLHSPVIVQLTLTDNQATLESEFEIFAQHANQDINQQNNQPDTWKRYASGTIKRADLASSSVDLTALRATLQADCAEVDSQQFYETYRQHGIDYGVTFQAVHRLWRTDRRAVAQIELPAAVASSAYQLHPILLDAALQSVAAALLDQSQTYLPVSIDQLVVHSSQQPSWSDVTLRTAEQSLHPVADLNLLDAQGQTVVTLKGLRLHPASPEPTEAANWQDWLYQLKWQPQPYQQAAALADSTKLNSDCDSLLASHHNSLIQYQQHLEELEALSLRYVACALLKLGWQFSINESISVQQVIRQLGIAAELKLVQRLLDMLAEAGWLNRQAEGYRVVQQLNADPMINVHTASPESRLLHRCGSALAEVLQGCCDPIQLLFPEGDLTPLSQIYQDSAGAQFTNQLLQRTVHTLLPQGRVRILEIGGGTGGTTHYLLPHLDAQATHYTFTDISPLFIQAAQKKFAAYNFVQYKTLDIERSPQDQGFCPQQYDVIIAANVLHATQNLQTSLSQIRQLLAPGGILVLLEGIHPMRWLDLTFGLTAGWWRFSDDQLRPDYPLISAEQWRQVLQDSGFESVEAIHPVVNNLAIHQAVIVAQIGIAPSSWADYDWLLVGDYQGLGTALANRLQAEGATYRFIDQSDQPSDRLEILCNRPTQAVFLSALEVSSLAGSAEPTEPTEPTVEALEADAETVCHSALQLLQSLPTAQPMHLWFVTQGAVAIGAVAIGAVATEISLAQSLLWGIGKTARLEHPEFNLVCVDLDPRETVAQQAERLLAEISAGTSEPQVAFRAQQRYVARLVQSSNLFKSDLLQNSQSCIRLNSSERGLLENLQLQEVERLAPAPGQIEIRVQATGLNFRDLLNALDLYPGEAGLLGCECVGKVSAVGEQVTTFRVGDRVMALASGSFSNWVTADTAMAVPIPALLSAEAAATVPVAFLTARHALCHLAQLKRGDRLLIHAAAGAVGQAAIQIAQQVGAEIYATASPEKWATLRTLGLSNLFSSRDLEFAAALMERTNGAGVDVVLNALAGEFIPKTLSVLRSNGRFIELGKTNWTLDQVQAEYPDVEYFQMDLVELCQQQPDLIQTMLRDTVEQIQRGVYHALPYSAFPVTDAIQAFRTMQQAKHIGKLVITQPASEQIQAQIRADSTYLITGGSGGLGLLVADWLVQQGAKHLVLVSRHAAETQQIQAWQQAGLQVLVAAVDVANHAQMAQLFETLEQTLPPLRGIIHAAGVLADGTLHQQTWDKFAAVLRPKLLGSWNLHQLSQSQPLDFYLLFSSATALLGSPGQSNHVAANVFLDTLAHYRKSLHLPALSINWGIWSEVGSAAARQADSRLKGIGTISPSQGLQAFGKLLSAPVSQIGVVPIQWREFLQQGIISPLFTALLTELLAELPTELQHRPVTLPQTSILQALESAPAAERRGLLQVYLCAQVSQVLGFQADAVALQKGFFDLGMDSLTSVELKNRLQADLNCRLPATVAFDYPTVEALADYLVNVLGIDRLGVDRLEIGELEIDHENNHQRKVKPNLETEELDNLSQNDLAALLAQELMEISGGKAG